MTTPPLPPEDRPAPTPEPASSADQEPSMTPQLAEHLTLDQLADLSVGEPPVDGVGAAGVTATAGAAATGEAHLAEARLAEAHLAACEQCRSELAVLSAEMAAVSGQLTDLLGLHPTARGAAGAAGGNPSGSTSATGPGFAPPVPVTVAARLDRVLASEAAARQAALGSSAGAGSSNAASPGAGQAGRAQSGSGQSGSAQSGSGQSGSGQSGTGMANVVPFAPSVPLRAPATASYVKQTGVVKLMLAAAMAAVVVGFGGYVISASAGLNEPSALSPTQVHPEALASQAGSLAQSRDLDAHPFSAAWRCARKVTTGRITAITPVYVGGEQNFLVYTKSGGVRYATLVSGCDLDTPTASKPVEIPE